MTTSTGVSHALEGDDLWRDDTRDEARARLRDAVAEGDYEGLLDAAWRRLFTTAAADESFTTELGALRYAQARLIAEETDAQKLAAGLSRVIGMILRAAKEQARVSQAVDDPATAALREFMERLQERAGREHVEET